MICWPREKDRISLSAGVTSSPAPALALTLNEGTGLTSSEVVLPLGFSQPGDANFTNSMLSEPSMKELRAEENKKDAVDIPSDRKAGAKDLKDIKGSSKGDIEEGKYVYQDYSFALALTPSVTEMPRRSSSQTMSFPERLYDILCRKDTRDIITWMPHGRSWIILKPKVFESTMLPRLYSSRCKHSSFIRQANGWGFRRITQGPDQNSYYHELFLRGMPHLCKRMKRPGTFKKLPADPDDEPDFHNMPPLPHLRPSENHSNNLPLAGVDAAEVAKKIQLEQQIAHQRRLLVESAVFNAINANNSNSNSAPQIQHLLMAQQQEALLPSRANNNLALLSALPIHQQNMQQATAAKLMASLPNVARERQPNNDICSSIFANSFRNNAMVGMQPLMSSPNLLASILNSSPPVLATEQNGNAHHSARRFSLPIVPNAATAAALFERQAQSAPAVHDFRRLIGGLDPSSILALQIEESKNRAALEARINNNGLLDVGSLKDINNNSDDTRPNPYN